MSTGVRTILISRWRPGGQSSFDLVREFAQELPHESPAAAWQRAVQLLTRQPLGHGSRAAIEEEHDRGRPALGGASFLLGRLHARRLGPTRRRTSSSSAAGYQRQAEGSGPGRRRCESAEQAARNGRHRWARRRSGWRYGRSAGGRWWCAWHAPPDQPANAKGKKPPARASARPPKRHKSRRTIEQTVRRPLEPIRKPPRRGDSPILLHADFCLWRFAQNWDSPRRFSDRLLLGRCGRRMPAGRGDAGSRYGKPWR